MLVRSILRMATVSAFVLLNMPATYPHQPSPLARPAPGVHHLPLPWSQHPAVVKSTTSQTQNQTQTQMQILS